MKKVKIVADSNIPFLNNTIKQFVDIKFLPFNQITRDSILDADGLIVRTRTKCNRNLLAGTRVKFIASATIGFDHIDTDYCESEGIFWTNAPGCNSSSVQQYVLAALLKFADEKKIQLDNFTLGIVGVGNVGSKVQKAAGLLGIKMLLNDPPRARKEGQNEFVSIEHIISESDIITLHVPLNLNGEDKTYHLADEEFFKKFRRAKVIINTSRGEVINSEELKKAIKSDKVSYCVLDVWETEPNIDLDLLNNVNIATPHIAGYSIEGKANAAASCINALNTYFDLGIDYNWYPKNLPMPEREKVITVNCRHKSKQQILSELITATYDIQKDDESLRNSPDKFENIRSEYYARREFSYYEVKLFNSNLLIETIVRELGFKLVE